MPLKDLNKLTKAVAAVAVAVAVAGGAVNTAPNLPPADCNQTVQVA